MSLRSKRGGEVPWSRFVGYVDDTFDGDQPETLVRRGNAVLGTSHALEAMGADAMYAIGIGYGTSRRPLAERFAAAGLRSGQAGAPCGHDRQ